MCKTFFMMPNVSQWRFFKIHKNIWSQEPHKRRETLIFLCKTCTLKAPRNFSRGRNNLTKVSKRYTWHSTLQRTNPRGNTASETFFIERNVKKVKFFKKLGRNFYLQDLLFSCSLRFFQVGLTSELAQNFLRDSMVSLCIFRRCPNIRAL